MKSSSIVLWIGFVLRVGLPTVFPALPFQLSTTLELATPINSYLSLHEAFFYLQNNINPYDGGVNHHPPLLVIFFNLFKEVTSPTVFEVLVNVLFAVVDVVIALHLVEINNWYNGYRSTRTKPATRTKPSTKSRFSTTGSLGKLSDELIISFYLFNPIIILTNLAHSALPLTLVFLTTSLVQLVKYKNLPRSMMSLGIASYLSYSPMYLIIPMLAMAHKLIPVDTLGRIYFQGPAIFISTCCLLFFSSVILTSSLDFLDQCYGVIIRFDKIQPNVGLWWYFFTEMFEFFTPFYLGVFNLFSFLFIIPLTIRFFEVDGTLGDSFLAFFLCYIWVSFLKSYPTIGDLGFGLSLAPIFSHTIFPYCKLIYVTGLTLLISLLLSPIFYYCWIVLGNGNSNFFYSINLIWGAVHVLILMDFIWGKMISDYCDENGIEEKRGEIRLTQR